MRVWTRAFINLLAKVMALALGLGLLGVVASRGPAAQGAFAIVASVEAAMAALVSGAGLWLARRFNQTDASQRQQDLRVAVKLSLAIAAVLSMLLGTVAWLSVQAQWRALAWLAVSLPLVLMIPTLAGLWLGAGRMVPMNAPLVLTPALALAVLMGWGAAGEGAAWVADPVQGVVVAWVGARALVALGMVIHAAWVWVRQPAASSPSRSAPDATLRRFLWSVGLANGLSLLNYRVSLWIVERQLGLEAAGVYSVAVQLAELVFVVSASMTFAVYARLGGRSASDAHGLARQTAALNVALAAIVALAIAGLARPLVQQVLPPAFEAALTPLYVLLPGMTLFAGASALSAYFTQTLGRPGWSAIVAGISLGLNAVLGWSLVPIAGAWGAALATSLSMGLAMIGATWSFARASSVDATLAPMAPEHSPTNSVQQPR